MTKQSNHPRRSRRSPLIAMLATLAFAGAGQALAPAPAAALHTDACWEPQSGLCNPVDDSPASGNDPSGESNGSGSPGGWPSAPPPPSAAPWDQQGSKSVSTPEGGGSALVGYFRHHCEKLSDRAGKIEGRRGDIWDAVTGRHRPKNEDPRDLPAWVRRAWAEWRELGKLLPGIESDWYDHSCTELGL